MLKTTEKAIECISGICNCDSEDSKCLWYKITNAKDSGLETQKQITKLIKLEAKTEKMKILDKKSK